MVTFSDDDKNQVMESWKKLAPNVYGASVLFYNELYKLKPSLAPGSAQDIHKQAEKAIYSIGFIISHLGMLNDNNVRKKIKKLVQGHLEGHSGLSHEDVNTVKKAFVMAAGEMLRGSWTKATALAWIRFLTIIEVIVTERQAQKEKYLFPIFDV